MTKQDELFFERVLDLVYGPEEPVIRLLEDDEKMDEIFRESLESYASKSLYSN